MVALKSRKILFVDNTHVRVCTHTCAHTHTTIFAYGIYFCNYKDILCLHMCIFVFLVYILLLIGYYNEVLLYYATRNTVQFSALLAALNIPVYVKIRINQEVP